MEDITVDAVAIEDNECQIRNPKQMENRSENLKVVVTERISPTQGVVSNAEITHVLSRQRSHSLSSSLPEHYDICICYDEDEDEHYYLKLHEIFERKEFKMWTPGNECGGKPRLTVLNEKIDRCTYIVVVVSDKTKTSGWLEREIHTSLLTSLNNEERSNCVIPILFGQYNHKDLPRELAVLTSLKFERCYFDSQVNNTFNRNQRLEREANLAHKIKARKSSDGSEDEIRQMSAMNLTNNFGEKECETAPSTILTKQEDVPPPPPPVFPSSKDVSEADDPASSNYPQPLRSDLPPPLDMQPGQSGSQVERCHKGQIDTNQQQYVVVKNINVYGGIVQVGDDNRVKTDSVSD